MMQRERWQTVEALFQAALERRPEERAAFLDSACSHDGALRREVESLLVADESAPTETTGGPLGRLLGELKAAESETEPDLVPRLQRALGERYRVERELRAGGMSRVFVAEETTLRRRVVVKV